MTPYSILIVEDESIPAHYLKKTLEHIGHTVVGIASDKKSTQKLILEHKKLDLILMDIKIKGSIDGISLAKEIQINSSVAILFITAYSDDGFLQRAKEINSIGYLIKPIQSSTLLSTIEIGMSHFKSETTNKYIQICDDVVFDEDEQSIKSNSTSIFLSHQEALLLKMFLENKNLLFSTEQLEELLENISPIGDGALRTTLWRLRKKLPKCITIENIYNSGYKLKFLS